MAVMSEVEDLLSRLLLADRRAAIWSAAQCARTVLHLVRPGENRPENVIKGAEAWARGEGSEGQCRPREDEEELSSLFGYVQDLSEGASIAALGVWLEVYYDELVSEEIPWSAARAASVTVLDFSLTDPEGYTAWASTVYTNELEEHDDPGSLNETHPVWRRHDAYLYELISTIRWPLTIPTREQICSAPPTCQVAWDLLAHASAPLSVPELLEAHARAGRLGLDWTDALQRAIAERTTDEPLVRALLGG